MSMLQRLKSAFKKMNSGVTIFDVPAAAQRRFLESLPEPADDMERSYLQYRCQMFLMKRGLPALLNCAAAVLLPLYSLKLRGSSDEGKEPARENGAALLYADLPSIVPDSLHEEFHIAQVKDFQSKLCLTAEDYAYLRQLRRRYPFAFYFRFKCMLKVAMYSHVIICHDPRAIICSEEYSFTSSLLTDYCRRRGVEHIDVMHGEKLFFIRDSFVHFDRFYVWDPYYIDLFTDLRAERTQFRVELPPSLRFPEMELVEKSVGYTYYLGNETREQIEEILSNLSKLKNRGDVVAIRLHPRYFDHSKFLWKDNRGFLIEQAAGLSIEESLLRTGCAISLYSTVLQQAALNGVRFAIDDVSDRAMYEKLEQLRFICLNREHALLSELIGEEGRHGRV